MLPDFKEKAVLPKDSLDIYMEHRLMMQARNRQQGEVQDTRIKYAPELMRRL
jgi:DNA replication licensing factor MCM7